MILFPIILTGIIALCAMIAVIQILKINQSSKETSFFGRYLQKNTDFLVSHNASIDAKTLLIIQIFIQAGLFAAGWVVTNHWYIGVLLAIFGFFIPRIYFGAIKKKNQEKFELSLKTVLNNMSSLVGAGFTISQAIQEIAHSRQTDKVQKKLFEEMDAMHKMGTSIPDVFKWYAEKTDSKDAQTLYSAIKMQSEIGGSEATILSDMASSIQKRIKTRSKIKTSLTETNITVRVFDIAPFLMIAGIFLMSPSYIEYYFSDIGKFGILCVAIVMFITGSLITRIMKRKVSM